MNNGALDLILPADRCLYVMNAIQAVLNAQPFVDLHPGTGYSLTHFAESFVNTTARPVEKPLGASRNRANSAGVSNDAVPAGPAFFFINADIPIDTDGYCIDGRKDRNTRVSFCQQLNSGTAGHGEQAVKLLDDLLDLVDIQGTALALHRMLADLVRDNMRIVRSSQHVPWRGLGTEAGVIFVCHRPRIRPLPKQE